MTECNFVFVAAGGDVGGIYPLHTEAICSAHGVRMDGFVTGTTARCVVGKAEDAAEAAMDGLAKRVEALERFLFPNTGPPK